MINRDALLTADMRAVLGTAEGRRILLGLMKASGMFTASGVADPVAEGRRLLGVSLFNLAAEVDWRLLLEAFREDFELAELVARASQSPAPVGGYTTMN